MKKRSAAKCPLHAHTPRQRTFIARPYLWRTCFAPAARGSLRDMVTLVLRIATIGVFIIGLLDLVGALVVNGSFNVPVLLFLLAGAAHVAVRAREEAEQWKAVALQLQRDLVEQAALLELRLHAAALATHTQILPSLLK